MQYDVKVNYVEYILGGYAEPRMLCMPDQRRVYLAVNNSTNGDFDIALSPPTAYGQGMFNGDFTRPFSLKYSDVGDLVKREFWAVIVSTNGILVVTEVLRVN